MYIRKTIESIFNNFLYFFSLKPKKDEKFIEFTRSIIFALVIAIIIRSMVFEPFRIPSGSMKPNFLVGDYLFVSKYYYGISNHSFPFSPNIFEGRKFVFNKPQRGDVVVFRIPTDISIYYIKRLVGIPGDKIQVKNGMLHINDEIVIHQNDGLFTDSDGKKINQIIETLPDHGTSFKILDETPFGDLDNTIEYYVPEKHYFFMGDNRDGSVDSRVIGGPVGFVPEENLVGKASLIFFSNSEEMWKIWKWIFSFDLKRFFIKVHP